MKTPLHIFLDTVRALAKRPFYYLSEKTQRAIVSDTHTACGKLRSILEKQNLKDTHAYRILEMITSAIGEVALSEVLFIQSLGNLIEVYQQGKPDTKTKKILQDLYSSLLTAKKSILEYHLLLESLEKKGAAMSEEQKKSADLKHLQNVGIFYVLEYTLQVLYEFYHLSDADKKKLLEEGLKVQAGSLPAYLPLENTLRQDLCLKLYNSALRERLLLTFYNFEDVLYTGDVKKISRALKAFNLELLQAFQDKGLETFEGLLYKPFGNNMSLEHIIKTINAMKI